MTTIVNDNKACCSLPPAEAEYTPKGEYVDVAGFKSYTIGDKNSKTVIISVMDVFGFSAQTVQAADILSTSGAYVILPDVFEGKPAASDLFSPPQSPEKQQTIQTFFSTVGSPPTALEKISKIVAELKSKGIEKIFEIGYCWGAKVTILSAAKDRINGIIMCHPSMLAAEDADNCLVPVANFPSGDENVQLMATINEKLKAKPFGNNCIEKTYADQIHGFAATRADLKAEGPLAAYKDVYQRSVDWVKSF
ncbi:dienelactone hydrolase [Dacryopinax primogenitus]|uniref:Dienelactone hydrolase n=1 Tax=Dacryopinax primogenitus (strain DJM 731) TaxID=1858805 RepID=M5G5J5_DACPD|nr:dienelactone hydrolase [Dacryopinax primogenitus]EJU05531.1 dienelactone hydrolase [Dacryopinax primogenitus]